MKVAAIITGGQTGVDRAAMDFALEHGIPLAGWCPKGRQAEDGMIDRKYPLRETPSAHYTQRTEWNIRDAGAIMIFTRGEITGGTALGLRTAQSLGKPVIVINCMQPPDIRTVRRWLRIHQGKKLGIGGPRESRCPGIYRETLDFMEKLFW